MSRPRSRAADYAVYLVVRLLICLIQALPPAAAGLLANGLAWLVYHLDRRHREVARDNLRQAFPEITDPRKIDRRVRETMRHFSALLIDILHMPRKLNTNNWRSHVVVADIVGRRLVEAVLSERPMLMVTGHFGNWEMGGYVMGLIGFPTFAIARRLDNPYLDRFLNSLRQRQGQTILDKNEDYQRMLEVLQAGGVLATLGDQDAGPRGLFVDFFGRPASTHKAVALFALEYRVPMLVTGVRRLGDGLRYEIHITDVILPEDYAGQPDAVRAITQRFTDDLECIIRQAPEQYFWLHRRWKHPPPKRKSKQVA
jgi:Kdo2-lipid IVA lauroyltransferase/acyltransferase